MQSGWQFYSQEAVPPQRNQLGSGYMHLPVPYSTASVLPPVVQHLTPVHDIDFQPSEVCPKNFVIFDQTDHRSQIMYHPAIAHKLNVPGLSLYDPSIQENSENRYANVGQRDAFCPRNVDSDDIDALLSLEEEETEEKEEYDEEEVSTARTYGNYGSNSPEYCSTCHSKPQKNVASSSNQKSSSHCGSSNSEKKRQKMKKMVNALRGIVPGGDEMSTVTVLDEAVRYLKSLKVEVQKLGVTNFQN